MSIKETHYDIFNLNRLFAMSSLFLFFLILWTFADDYVRSWKDYQKEFRQLESNLTIDLLSDESSRIEELEDYKLALNELEKSQIDLNVKKANIDSIGEIISKLKDDQFKFNQELGFAKSVYDVAKFEYEYAVTYYSSKKIESAKKNMNLLFSDVEKNTLLVQDIEASLLNENNKLSQITDSYDQSLSKITQLEMQKNLYDRKLKTVDPNSMTLPNKIANFIRDLPILDLSNPYYKINQVIIPDIKENMIMAEVSRVDRCMTCHLGIDKKGYEDAPQPYTTHPNLDLYVSSASAHSNEEFGCTSCHAGRGRGTDFTTSTHSPSSPEQEEEWVEKYDWKEMHHWQTPMYPSQHYEAGCLKCHSSEASIPESKDLNIGLALFEKASCNGCHYVERYDGNLNQRIGPNLTHLSSKTDKEWTYRWVINPQNFRHNTWMPNFFELMEWENETDSLRTNQEIHAIVDYLFDNIINQLKMNKIRWFDFGTSNEAGVNFLNSGLYNLKKAGGGSMNTYCDFNGLTVDSKNDGGGWTLVASARYDNRGQAGWNSNAALNSKDYGKLTGHWHMSMAEINALKGSKSTAIFRAECYDSNNNFIRYWGGVTSYTQTAATSATWSNTQVDQSGTSYPTAWVINGHYGLTSGKTESTALITAHTGNQWACKGSQGSGGEGYTGRSGKSNFRLWTKTV